MGTFKKEWNKVYFCYVNISSEEHEILIVFTLFGLTLGV